MNAAKLFRSNSIIIVTCASCIIYLEHRFSKRYGPTIVRRNNSVNETLMMLASFNKLESDTANDIILI